LNQDPAIMITGRFNPGGDGNGATRPLPRNGGAEEFLGNPTVRQCPKVWTRYQRLK